MWKISVVMNFVLACELCLYLYSDRLEIRQYSSDWWFVISAYNTVEHWKHFLVVGNVICLYKQYCWQNWYIHNFESLQQERFVWGAFHLGSLTRPVGRVIGARSWRVKNVSGIWNRILNFNSFYAHFFLNTPRFDGTSCNGAPDYLLCKISPFLSSRLG
jgi:hypothetical protein